VRAEPTSCEQQQGGGTIPPLAGSSAPAKPPPCSGSHGVWHSWALLQPESPDPTENGRFETLKIF